MTSSDILAPGPPSGEKVHLFEQAAGIVREGGIVIVATETFYALAADPFNEEAVRRVFHIKGRSQSKPLPLIASDRLLVEELAAHVPDLAKSLMDRFWPGSLTILFQPTRPMSPYLIGAGGKFGARVPEPCPARIVAEGAGGWITATSANRSGEPDPSTIGAISQRVIDLVDLVVDSGPTPGGRPSTLVAPLDSDVRVLRRGAVPEDVIKAFVMEWQSGRDPKKSRDSGRIR